jgi:manganese oxidase
MNRIRTRILAAALAVLSGATLSAEAQSYTPVVTPSGETLPYKLVGGVKEFHLTVEEIDWEIAPGMKIKAWGYNGRTPGPTIEAVEGDRVRILVTNKLKEPTAVHWHGLLLPSGMDGVSGLNQRPIPVGDTFKYEFSLRQHGTQMYHSHGDEMMQMGMGAMGFFIIHPKERKRRIDRDYAIFVNEWSVEPGAAKPNPSVMTDFNTFTFNSKAYPGTAPLVARTGDRVRVRIGNVGQECHPVHLHGHTFKIVATDGGDIPESAQWPEQTAHVCPGQTRDFEFTAIAGDWAMHCHRRHHPMNAMGHDIPLALGVNQKNGVEEKVSKLVPGYMAMGEHGMEEMTEMQGHMKGPANTLPMMTANDGPFGSTGMGGMFTVLKVRDAAGEVKPGGWYKNPPGTVAETIKPRAAKSAAEATMYACPMHPEVRQNSPGKCPKCGMTLVPETPKEHEGHEGMKMDGMQMEKPKTGETNE